jgi:hypothetical protein
VSLSEDTIRKKDLQHSPVFHPKEIGDSGLPGPRGQQGELAPRLPVRQSINSSLGTVPSSGWPWMRHFLDLLPPLQVIDGCAVGLSRVFGRPKRDRRGVRASLFGRMDSTTS